MEHALVGTRWRSDTGLVWKVVGVPKDDYVTVEDVRNGETYCWHVQSLLCMTRGDN